MRFLAALLTLLIAAVATAGVTLRTPETDYETMLSRYGGADARFARTEDGLEVHYRDQGFAEGPVVVLVHGSNASLHTWEPLVERLKGAYRLISYDQPGHGLTGAHPDGDYSADGMIDALEAVLETAEVDEFYLAGNSMGGWVAWRYALEAPERLEGLVLLDASGAPLPPEVEANVYLGAKLMQHPVGRWMVKRYTPRFLVEQSLRDSVTQDQIVTDEMVDRYWELVRLPRNKEATLARATTDREPEVASRLGEIGTPTLIIWGADDEVVPVEAAAVFDERIPSSEAVIIENVGHLPMEEAPDEIAGLLENWIARVEADGAQ